MTDGSPTPGSPVPGSPVPGSPVLGSPVSGPPGSGTRSATKLRLPAAADRLLRNTLRLVGLESPSVSPPAEPGLATAPAIEPERETMAATRAVGGESRAAIPAAEPPSGRRGVDYEVVSKRRGPGTFGALLFLALLGLVAWTAGSRAYRWVQDQLDPPGEPTHEIVFTLPPGSSTSSISDLLAEQGVIESSRAYEWYVRLKGGPAFQAGEYTFRANSSVWETMEVLEAGPSRVAQAFQRRLTIPEGLTVAQMAELLDETPDLAFSGQEFIEATRSRRLSLVAPAPINLPDGVIDPAEGQLFADTYFVDGETSAEQLVALMVDRLDAVLIDLDFRDAPQRVGLTPYEVLVVASMIEREAQRPQDLAKVARVIYNRLQQGWSLGLDATVVYAVGSSELTVELLAVNSPYNTRLFVGLPPTPIAAPSRASLEAALNPEPGPWMFFVLTDADGTLSFSETIEEFQRDKAVCVELGLCG